jgi:hypothetical protein
MRRKILGNLNNIGKRKGEGHSLSHGGDVL